jgi:hypothetical protein
MEVLADRWFTGIDTGCGLREVKALEVPSFRVPVGLLYGQVAYADWWLAEPGMAVDPLM